MIHLGKRLARPLAVATVALVSMAMVVVAPGTASAGSMATAAHHPVVARTDAGTMTATRVTGTVEDGRRLVGTFTPTSFSVEDVNGVQTMMANGTLDGMFVGKGKPTSFQDQPVSLPVQGVNSPGGGTLAAGGRGMATSAVGGSCDILHLTLGPLDLDLLGLQVHLDRVVLDIVAQSGAGNLLGNLLCAVAGLLDSGSPLSDLLGQLTTLLNQILGQLGLLQL